MTEPTGSGWRPLATMPRDGREVELFSPSEGVDRGYWYMFGEPEWAANNPRWHPHAGLTDTDGDFNTDNGSGDYTHWRDIGPRHD